MISQWLEEGFVSFIGGHKYCGIFGKLVHTLLVQYVGVHAGALVLEVTSTNVQRVKQTIRIALGISRPRSLSDEVNGPRSCALHLILISEMVSDEALGPQVLQRTLKIKECIKVNKQSHSHLVVAHEMDHGSFLHFLIVDAKIPSEQILLHPILGRAKDIRGALILVLQFVTTRMLGHDIGTHLVQIFNLGWSGCRWEGREAFVWLPEGGKRDFPEVFLQRGDLIPAPTIPIGAICRREHDNSRRSVPQVSRHCLAFQELLHGDDIETLVLVAQTFEMVEVSETKMFLMFLVPFAQQIHSLFWWHYQRPAGGVRERNDSFHRHPLMFVVVVVFVV
mmetsp:Transcript_29988/g.87560  ORF Transcript_29988/g.87560 Transcript_29988/m.87560 type:complete len:335 (-) Transcript_29988:981-1985(-)